MTDSRQKIAFIHSPEIHYEQNYGVNFIPVWAYTLASYVDETAWAMAIYDLTIENVNDVPEVDVFAFSGINQDIASIKQAYKQLKERYPQAKFILGGPITWSYEQSGNLEQLLFMDHVFILDGEETLPQFLTDHLAGKPMPQVIRLNRRFPIENAKPMRFDLLEENIHHYYGAVLEVSRGCPFLCEFCDIRVLPNNNEAHNKKVELILYELKEYYRLGIRQIQFACDNFIGHLPWARECAKAIADWRETNKGGVAIYTWLTVNVSTQTELLKEMRRAGFTTLFIGVESFHDSSIIETSKVQNRNDDHQMEKALDVIHSYGFIVVPGLIFGFDSDSSQMFKIMLAGIRLSGLIGGDPTFLLALPGTPLYRRMKLTNRLIEFNEDVDTIKLENVRVSKIESNIRYLQPSNFLVEGFIHFIKTFVSGEFAYGRFKKHVEIITSNNNSVDIKSVAYGNLWTFLAFQFSAPKNLYRFSRRILMLCKPSNFWAIAKAYLLVLKHRKTNPGLKTHFTFWIFAWSNLLMKYHGFEKEDFKIESIPQEFPKESLWSYGTSHHPEQSGDYGDLKGGKTADNVKVVLQFKTTQKAMASLRENVAEPEYLVNAYTEELARLKKAV